MEDLSFNIWAILVAAIVPLVVGSIYYGPLFGKVWQNEVGMTDEELKAGNYAKIFGLSLLFAFFIAVTLWMQVMLGGAPGEAHGAAPYLTFKHGVLHGAMMGIFLILPVIGTIALYERKSLRYVLLTVGYWTISMAVMGGIINVWP